MEIFKSDQLILAISTKEDGNMREKINQKNFAKKLGFNSLKTVFQIHKDKVAQVDRNSKKEKADGLITKDKKIALGITVADCFPVFLYNDNEIGLVHSGWKGTSLNIVSKAVEKMNKKNLKAFIGPGILKCHFKVKNDLLKIFPSKNNYVDLLSLIEKQLLLQGIKKSNIISKQECTFCSPKYFSYRRGDQEAMLAIIGHKKSKIN